MDSEAATQQLNAKQVSVLAMLRESPEELSGQDLHQRLRLNGQPIGPGARKLADNDVITLAGVKMGFFEG